MTALAGAVLLPPAESLAASATKALTCAEVEGWLREVAASFDDMLPVPDFVDDKAWPGSRTTRKIPNIEVYLSCDEARFRSYERFLTSGNTAALARWTLWSQASLIATDKRLDRDKAFRLVQRLQKAAIAESVREEIKSGDRLGWARVKSGAFEFEFEFEYSVQSGQTRVAFRPTEDEMDSCKLLR